VVMRCLEKDPASRPAGARAVAELIAACDLTPAPLPARVPAAIAAQPTMDIVLPSGGLALPPPPPLSPSLTGELEPPRSRRALGIVLGLAVIGVVAVGAAVVLDKGKGQSTPTASAAGSQPAALDATVPEPANTPKALDAAPEGLDAAEATHVPRPRETAREIAADHLNKAAAFRRKGDRIQERVQLQKALEVDPANAEAHFLLGEGALADGNHELACKHLKRALALKKAKLLHEKAGCDLVTP
jgi:hypothetical protein